MQREKALAVTGHRWQKLPFGEDESDARCVALVNIITGALTYRVEGGISHILCGLALGFDTLVAEAVIRLMETIYPYITMEAVLFCPNQSEPWTLEQKQRFERILTYCIAPPTITSPEYVKGCEMIRNRYMVDNSGVLLAGWDGSPSGTGNTVRYARETSVPVIQVNPRNLGKRRE